MITHHQATLQLGMIRLQQLYVKLQQDNPIRKYDFLFYSGFICEEKHFKITNRAGMAKL